MTDLEKFIDTYKQFGIELKVKEYDDCFTVYLNGGDMKYETTSEKFDGYCGFFSDVDFDLNGKFLRQGFYEA